MHTLSGLPVLFAGSTGQFNAHCHKHGQPSALVTHLYQTGVEVDLTRQCTDSEECRVPHDRERGDGLIEKPCHHNRQDP
eukprot:543055-Rhodomonas_salina.2